MPWSTCKVARGQARLLELADAVIRWALDALDEQRVRRFLARLSRKQIERLDLAPLAGYALEWLVRGNRHQDVLTQVLRHAIVLLHEHRENIRERVQEESPWWIPGFVDDHILKKMLERIEHHLFEMSLDPRAPAARAVQRLADRPGRRVADQPGIPAQRRPVQAATAGKRRVAGLPVRPVGGPGARACATISTTRNHGCAANCGQPCKRVASELEADAGMQAWINDWLTETVVTLVDGNRTADCQPDLAIP